MPRPIRLPKPAAKRADPLDLAAKRLQDGADATKLLKQLDADPYACLGLSKTTDDASVKKAYRRRALRFHPDKCTSWDSTELFQALGWAFERLETSEKRRAFAAERAAAPSAPSSGPRPASGQGPSSNSYAVDAIPTQLRRRTTTAKPGNAGPRPRSAPGRRPSARRSS